MTTISISSLTATPSVTPKKKSKLNRLWSDIEKKRQRNQRYQTKLDKFFQAFKASTETSEQAVCLATEGWIYHLLSFIPRKTIKGAQRDALYNWIQEELTVLESNPFNPVNTSTLRDAFSQALVSNAAHQPVPDHIPAEALDAFRDELEMMIGDESDLSNEALMEMIREPQKLHSYFEQLFSKRMEADVADDDEETGWGAEDFFSGHDPNHELNPPCQPASKALYNDKQMTKLYRQLAKQLHPDKETDAGKKAEKNVLMQQLSQAKKDKDVVALLLLAQQYLPDHEMVMDDDLLERLEITLKEKLSQLSIEYSELQHGSDIKSIVWQKFGGSNRASRERDLEKYRTTLQREAQSLRQRCLEVKTVKQMQQHLRERVDSARFYQQLMSLDPSDFFAAEEDGF